MTLGEARASTRWLCVVFEEGGEAWRVSKQRYPNWKFNVIHLAFAGWINMAKSEFKTFTTKVITDVLKQRVPPSTS